jgi:hypothetical protein
MDHRQTLISSGVHIGAERRLGSSYTNAEYVQAAEAATAAGDGTAYADRVLGADPDMILQGVEEEDVVCAAEADLRDRGIDPAAATQAQYRDALVRASS